MVKHIGITRAAREAKASKPRPISKVEKHAVANEKISDEVGRLFKQPS
jgi:hypothetical protein